MIIHSEDDCPEDWDYIDTNLERKVAEGEERPEAYFAYQNADVEDVEQALVGIKVI
jgi:hypothetical protein